MVGAALALGVHSPRPVAAALTLGAAPGRPVWVASGLAASGSACRQLPSDDAVTKLLYLALRNIEQR